MNILWKISHFLYKKKINIIAMMFQWLNMILFSNSVFGECEIGKGTRFHHHALGCTVHPLAAIGNNNNIFTNVTIGRKWTNGKTGGGLPKIGNNVTIGAGAVILGDITIGDNSIIGANAVVLKNVPPDSIAVGIPAKIKMRSRLDNC